MCDDERLAAATEALARAWNRLDWTVIEPWLADDVVYEAHDVEMALDGKSVVLDYLRRKMELINRLDESALVRAQLGRLTAPGCPDRPCVISGQGELDRAALFLVELAGDGRVCRITVSTTSPDPDRAEALGIFPG